MKRIQAALLTGFLMSIAAAFGCGQSVSRSYTIPLNNTTTIVVTAPVPNVGQSAHQFYACLGLASGTTGGSASLEIQASSDGTHYASISPSTFISTTNPNEEQSPNCVVLSGNGYYNSVRLAVYNAAFGGGSSQGTLTATYTGSMGVSPIGGEARTSSAAQKVSAVPPASSYSNTALKSTAHQLEAAPALPATVANYVYAVLVYNPNASPVYVQVATTATTSSSPALLLPVGATQAMNLSLANPVYSPGDLYIACSSAPDSNTDPATGCVVQIFFSSVPGANTQVSATGTVISTDNTKGSIPHE